nr:lytic murein transglycosylase [Malonomonas rubra]
MDFSDWLDGVRSEALILGISEATIEVALRQAEPLPWVIKADRNQPEFKKTLEEYLSGVLSNKRIEQGRRRLIENRQLLNQISRKYGVQPRFIVALWGIETYYGKHTGKVSIIDALVTLAFDGRRSDYFRKELFNALKIIDSGHVSYEKMKGSWAGAMGQVQFMPSSFLNYAVDGNSDGRIDLWHTPEDYLSSAANYLAIMGWDKQRTWGRKVLVPKGLDINLAGMEKTALLSTWRKYGVRSADGQSLPKVKLRASLILPEGAGGDAFLIYDNYRALMKWNRAHSFALAVGMLADRVMGKNH